jgi:hypothetical protein
VGPSVGLPLPCPVRYTCPVSTGTGTLIFAGLIIFGLIFEAIGLTIGRGARRFRARAESTQGTVVSQRMVSRVGSAETTAPGPDGGAVMSTGSGPVYLPTVSFTTREGHQVQAEAPIGGNPPLARPGRTVRVLYDPGDPQRVRIDSVRGRGGCLGVAFALIGLIPLAIGVIGQVVIH